MRKTLIVLGFIAAILAVILVVTPLFKISIVPALLAVLCGLGVWYFSIKQKLSKKVVQYIFLLATISIVLLTYKSVVDTSEVGDVQELEELEKKSEEDAIEALEGIEITE